VLGGAARATSRQDVRVIRQCPSGAIARSDSRESEFQEPDRQHPDCQVLDAKLLDCRCWMPGAGFRERPLRRKRGSYTNCQAQ